MATPRQSSPHPSSQSVGRVATPRSASKNNNTESPTMHRLPVVITSASNSPSASAPTAANRSGSSTVVLPKYAVPAVVQAWVVYREPGDLDWARRWVRITEETFDIHLNAQDPTPQESLTLRELFVGTSGGRRFRISTGQDDFLEFRCCDDKEYDEFIAALLARCRKESEATAEVDWKGMYDDLLRRYNELQERSGKQGKMIDDLEKEKIRIENLYGDLQVEKLDLMDKIRQGADRIRYLENELSRQAAMARERDLELDRLERELAELRKPKPVADASIQCLIFDPSQYSLVKERSSVGTQSMASAQGSHGCQTTLTGPVVSTRDVVNRPTCHVMTQTQVTGPVWNGRAGNDLAQFTDALGRVDALTKVLPQLPVSHLDLAVVSPDDLESITKAADAIPKTLGMAGVQNLPTNIQRMLANAKAKVREYKRLLAEREALRKKARSHRPVDLQRAFEGIGWLDCAATVTQVKKEKADSPSSLLAEQRHTAGGGPTALPGNAFGRRGSQSSMSGSTTDGSTTPRGGAFSPSGRTNGLGLPSTHGRLNTALGGGGSGVPSSATSSATSTAGGGGGTPSVPIFGADPAAKWRKLNKLLHHDLTAGSMAALHDDMQCVDLSSLDGDLRGACEKFLTKYKQMLKATGNELEYMLSLNDWEQRCRECIGDVDGLKEMLTVEHIMELPDAVQTYRRSCGGISQRAVALVEEEPFSGHPLANILCTRIAMLHADFYARTQRDTRDFLRHNRSAESIARFALSLKRASQIVAKVRGCEMFAVEFAAAWPVAGELVELPRRMMAEDLILTQLKDWVSMDLTIGRLRMTDLLQGGSRH